MSEAYDRGKLVELFGDDPGTLSEVEREFLETARSVEREISTTENLLAIARAAHRLKGAAGVIGAVPLHALAKSVEIAAKASDLKTVRGLSPEMRREVERVAAQVAAHA
ncbi:MAG: Hpt domain-containing protein [Alphaproteobacteria bacterium]|nr:Hpt domain-containing protein [Alphaproteobacteria bacterium]